MALDISAPLTAGDWGKRNGRLMGFIWEDDRTKSSPLLVFMVMNGICF